MKLLIFCMIFPSLLFSPSSQINLTVSQNFSIENFTSTIIAQLDGEVEVVMWDGEELKVETTIVDQSSDASKYTLNYAVSKGNYALELSQTDDVNVLLLKSKKVNRTIFRKGNRQQTKQHYKIFIPRYLDYSIQ